MFHQAYSNILIKFRQPSIFELDDIGKSYTPQKKAQTYSQPCTSIQGFLLMYKTL